MNAQDPLLDRLLEPLSRCLDEPSARAVAGLRADAEVVREIQGLAELAREGTLSEADQRRYES